MSEEKNQIIIIKRIKKSKAVHHGGAWKIAYADFVTAMMAFFMLMWLLSLLNKYQLNGVANYFKKPLIGSHIAKSSINEKQPNVNKPYRPKLEEDLKNTTEEIDPKAKLEKMKQDLKNALMKDEQAKQFADQLEFEIGDDGLKVDLHELKNKPMFQLGRWEFNDQAKKIIRWLSQQLNQSPNRVVIIGHTDTYQYKNEGKYTNWELSADRANSMRKLLLQYGMDPNKIIRVQGAATTNLLNKKNGADPVNRRIEIIVLTDEAAAKLLNE